MDFEFVFQTAHVAWSVSPRPFGSIDVRTTYSYLPSSSQVVRRRAELTGRGADTSENLLALSVSFSKSRIAPLSIPTHHVTWFVYDSSSYPSGGVMETITTNPQDNLLSDNGIEIFASLSLCQKISIDGLSVAMISNGKVRQPGNLNLHTTYRRITQIRPHLRVLSVASMQACLSLLPPTPTT